MEYFRVRSQQEDVWNNLSRNWNHFYWLTGENPDTLNIVVQRLRARFPQINRRRRQVITTFPNQVIYVYNFNNS